MQDSRKTSAGISFREQQLQTTVNDLEEKLKNQEQMYKEKLSRQIQKLNVDIDGSKNIIQDQDFEISEKNKTISNLKQEIITLKYKNQVITKDKENIIEDKRELENTIQDLYLKIQTLKIQIQPQVDVSKIIENYNQMLQKLKDENKIQIDEQKKEKQKLKEKLNEIHNELEKKSEELQNKSQEVDKEHKWFLEARDEIVKLKKDKDELEKQISTQSGALSSADQKQLNLEGEISQKNLDIEFLQNQVDVQKKFIQQLIESLQNNYTSSQIISQNINISQYDQYLQELQDIFNKKKNSLTIKLRKIKIILDSKRQINKRQRRIKEEIKLNNIINQQKMAINTCMRLKNSQVSWMSVLLLMQLDLWMITKIKPNNHYKQRYKLGFSLLLRYS